MSNRNEQKPKPIGRFSSYGIEAAIWQGKEDRLSVTVKKTYKEKESNKYIETNTFFPDELPRLALVVQQAYEFCVLKTG